MNRNQPAQCQTQVGGHFNLSGESRYTPHYPQP